MCAIYRLQSLTTIKAPNPYILDAPRLPALRAQHVKKKHPKVIQAWAELGLFFYAKKGFFHISFGECGIEGRWGRRTCLLRSSEYKKSTFFLSPEKLFTSTIRFAVRKRKKHSYTARRYDHSHLLRLFSRRI